MYITFLTYLRFIHIGSSYYQKVYFLTIATLKPKGGKGNGGLCNQFSKSKCY